jgi:hypothetical protein
VWAASLSVDVVEEPVAADLAHGLFAARPGGRDGGRVVVRAAARRAGLEAEDDVERGAQAVEEPPVVERIRQRLDQDGLRFGSLRFRQLNCIRAVQATASEPSPNSGWFLPVPARCRRASLARLRTTQPTAILPCWPSARLTVDRARQRQEVAGVDGLGRCQLEPEPCRCSKSGAVSARRRGRDAEAARALAHQSCRDSFQDLSS